MMTTLHDTARMNDLEESTAIYLRQLVQRITELAQTMSAQRDTLRHYGMGVSPTAQAPTTQAEVVAPPTTKPSEKPSSMLYLLVLAGLVIAGLIIVIIVLFFRKKN